MSQLYKAIEKSTGKVLGVGGFGRAYDLAYGTYEERKAMTAEAVRARSIDNGVEKLFDFTDDYSTSNNMLDWFDNAVKQVEENRAEGLDFSEVVSDALDNSVSVYTYDILEAATQDTSLALESSEYMPEGATAFDILSSVIYRVLDEAIHAYFAALDSVEAEA